MLLGNVCCDDKQGFAQSICQSLHSCVLSLFLFQLCLIMTNFTECLKKRMFCWVSNPRRGITIAWLVSLLLVVIAFIVACVAASKIHKSSQSGSGNGFGQAAGFGAMWTVLLLILISVGGTIIMRRYQTSLSIGFFLGVIFVMCQQMLILFAIFTEVSQKPGQSAADVSSQEAMAVFCFFLFVVYGLFGGLLSVFRFDIIKEEVLTDEPVDDAYGNQEAQDLPPQEEEY